MVWSDIYRDRSEVLSWLAAVSKGEEAIRERAAAGPTFAELATERLEGVQSGVIGWRKGRKRIAYSPTTLAGYQRSPHHLLVPEFGRAWRPRSTKASDKVGSIA
jgi:hypothetical protein